MKSSEVIFSQAFATLAANVLIYFELSIMAKAFFVLKMFLIMAVMQIIIAIVWTSIAQWIYRKVFPPRKLLLIHGDRDINGILAKFASRKDKYDIVQCVHVNKGLEYVGKEILTGLEGSKYDGVVIWDVSTAERNEVLKFCYAKSVRVYTMPKITDVILMGAEELHLFDTFLSLLN